MTDPAGLRPQHVVALASGARDTGADDRERLRLALAQRLCGRPSVVISTCHRVEAYVDPAQGWRDLGDQLPAGSRLLADDDAVRHLFSVAVGLDSAVLGEDEVLHQVRQGVEAGRSNAPLSPVLERLFQEALRTGRRARAERPKRPISLAEAALTRVMPPGDRAGRSVLVVGTGAMGRRAARAARQRGARLFVTSRQPARAAALAEGVEAQVVPFDPWSQLPHRIDLVVIALAGPWTLAPASVEAMDESGATVIDLSAPPALTEVVRTRLGTRLVSIDQLAMTLEHDPDGLSPERRRLEAAVSAGMADFAAWLERRGSMPVVHALSEHAENERLAELEHLWRQLPELEAHQRLAIEAMTRHLTRRLLREPVSRLAHDASGRRADAARDLFGL